MLLRKAFQFRLKPKPAQRLQLAQTAGCVRLVWNASLAKVQEQLDAGEGYSGYVPMANQLTALKKTEERCFLKLVHSQSLQQTLKDLDRALRDGFKKKKGFPKFKKKSQDKSFRYPQGVKLADDQIFLPKIGWLAFVKSREVEGIIKNTAVSFDCGEWYVSIQVEMQQDIAEHPGAGNIIGLDMGVKSFVTSSDGQHIMVLGSFRKHAQRLRKEQRKLSRKRKGSKNREKQKYRMQRIHKKIRDCRKDFLHKAANQFCKNHAVIVLEDLAVCNMSASARGSKESPGRRVKQKSGLNKSLLDQAWYQFRQILTYKQEWLGGLVIAVPAPYTSQRCSACDKISAASRKSQWEFVCVYCGYSDHADINAAKNIKAAGSAVLACRDISPVRVSAQESPPSGARVSR